MMEEDLVTSTPMTNPTNRRITFLRRGGASNTPENFLNESNDEVERSERRRSVLNRSVGAVTTPVGNDSTNALSQDEVRSQLATFYRLFQENKINASNVWNLKVIDCLKQLVKSSSNDVLKIAGSSLEVAGKVYGIRVDDLHSGALKLASHWARVFASKQKDDDNNDGDNNIVDEEAPGDKSKKKKQPKKRRFGLAKNKQHILCADVSQLMVPGKKLPKLESDRFSVPTDPKLSSCENLLTNKLRMNTAGSAFSMRSNEKSWNYYGDSSDASVKPQGKIFPINLKPVDKYRLCWKDFRMDQWFPDETTEAPENLATTLDPLVVSAAGIPIAELDDSVHDPLNDGDIEHSDIEDIEENVAEQAPLYRTDLPFVVDFAPSESSSLTNLTNNSAIWRQSHLLPGPSHQWAGPEHWKYKGLKNNPLIYTGKENQKGQQKKKSAQKKEYEPLDLTNLKPPVDFTNYQKYKNPKTCINVDPAKIRLPLCLPDLSFRELMDDLNCLTCIPTIRVRPFSDDVNGGSNIISENNTNNNATNHNNSGNNDSNDLADDIFDNADAMDEDIADDDRPAAQEGEAAVTMMDFIGDNLIDPPEMVEPVDLKYATKAKKTNMKKLKKDVWCVLTQQPEYDEAAKVIQTTFWEMAELVEQRHGTENSSIPLIFVSLLHLANEQNLLLEQQPNDFKISGPNL